MAFRLRPLHEDTLQFAGLSNTQILILALEASQKLEWNIEELTLEGVRFDVPMSIKSHGEEITVSIRKEVTEKYLFAVKALPCNW